MSTIFSVAALSVLGGVQVLQFLDTKNSISKLTQQYSQLSDENKQDIVNSYYVQQQIEQLTKSLKDVDVKNVLQTLQDFKSQLKSQQQQFQQQQQQFQTLQQKDVHDYTLVTDTVVKLQNSLDCVKKDIGKDTQQYDKLNKVQQNICQNFSNLQKQFQSLQDQQKQLVKTSQELQDVQNLNNLIKNVQNQVDSVTSKLGTVSQSAQNLSQMNINRKNPGAAKLNIAPTGKKNPDINAIYQYTNDKDSDAILATRVQKDTTGNPYTSYDHEGVMGWTTGMDVQDNHNYSVKNNWTFDGKPAFTVDKTGNVGIGQDVPRPQKYKLDVAGNSKFGQVNVNTPDPGPAKINVTSSGLGNPDNNGIYVRAPDLNTDALVTTRVPKGSKSNPAITFDHDGVAGYQMGMSTALDNAFILARDWHNLGADPAFKLEKDGGITLFTDNFRVCKRGGDYKNCANYNPK